MRHEQRLCGANRPFVGIIETMTNALQKAFAAASKLPDQDQDALAAAIVAELAADERWEAALAATPDALGRLADEALGEHRAGRSKPLD